MLATGGAADFSVLVHLLDPRGVTHTEKTFPTGWEGGKTDLLGTERVVGEAATGLRGALGKVFDPEEATHFCGHSPGYGVEFFEGEGREFATTVCFECETWIKGGRRRVLGGTKVEREALLQLLRGVIEMPAVFLENRSVGLERSMTVAELEAWWAKPRREAKVIELKQAGGEAVAVKVPGVAYVNGDGWVSVFPGETVVIEFDLVDGKYVNPHYVETVVNEKRTMTIKCTQDERMAMLDREHGIAGKNVKYRVFVQYVGAKRWDERGVWPQEANFGGFDTFDPRACAFLIGEIEVSERPREVMYEEIVDGRGSGSGTLPAVLVDF